MPEHLQHFASDNYAGVYPEAMTAFAAANAGHAPAYGEDDWTREVSDRLRALSVGKCSSRPPSKGVVLNHPEFILSFSFYHIVF